jgi:hypothetical protein
MYNQNNKPGGATMGISRIKQMQKDASMKAVFAGKERREIDDPNYFGYFLLEGRERRWAENMIVTRTERAIAGVLSKLHEYKHLGPYGVM